MVKSFSQKRDSEKIRITKTNRFLIEYKYFRPQIVKLFTHLVLLYITIRAFLEFQSSETNYTDFKANLDDSIVTDIKIVNSNESCESPYTDVDTTFYPSVDAGCRCDYQVFKSEFCDQIYNTSVKDPSSQNWSTQCALQDKAAETKINQTKRLLQDSSNTQQNASIQDQAIPKKCNCYQNISKIANYTIDIWLSNQRICILKQNVSTLDYLKSSSNNSCFNNTCQNYFCLGSINSTKCPIIDIYFDHKNVDNSSSGNTLYNINNDQWNMYSTTIYNKTIIDLNSFANKIYLPVKGISYSRSGMCIDGSKKLESSYSLVNNSNCPIDQSYYTTMQLPMKTVLNNNNNYYDLLSSKLPLFDFFNQANNQWNFDIQYAFYRDTITCLLSDWDIININGFLGTITNATAGSYENQRLRLNFILVAFIEFDSSYTFQSMIQIILLVLNVFVVFLNLVVIFYKILKIVCSVKFLDYLVDKEIYISFVLDLSTAGLGGASYFIITSYLNFLTLVSNTNCLDQYVTYQLAVFGDSLQNTSEQNLNLFIIMLFKIFLIVFSILYYWIVYDCKLTCNEFYDAVKENINEGEYDIDDNVDDGNEKNESKEEGKGTKEKDDKENKEEKEDKDKKEEKEDKEEKNEMKREMTEKSDLTNLEIPPQKLPFEENNNKYTKVNQNDILNFAINKDSKVITIKTFGEN